MKMIEFFVKISLKKTKTETKKQKFSVEGMNCKIMLAAQKSKHTSQKQMTPNILKRLQQGIKEGSYLKLYPIIHKRMECQLSGQQTLLGPMSVILDAQSANGILNAKNDVIRLFYGKLPLKNASIGILYAASDARIVNANVVQKAMNVLIFFRQQALLDN